MMFKYTLITLLFLFFSNSIYCFCPPASGLYTDNYSFNSTNASIDGHWDSMEDTEVDHFMIRYKEVDGEEWLNMLSNENFKTIWPLDFNTTYVWTVVAYCSENQSDPAEWSPIDTFSTPEYIECPVPVNIFTNNIIVNENQAFADGNWDSMLGMGVDHFMLDYKQLSDNDSSWITLSNMDSTTVMKTMGNLSLNTSYEWRVKSFCSVNQSYYSDWSVRDTFEIGEFVPQPFQPNTAISINNQICEGLSDVTISLSQSANQPDIQSSIVLSNSGKFEISDLDVGQEIGEASIMAGNGFFQNDYTLVVNDIINDNKAEIALKNIESGFIDDYFDIENEGDGIKIFILSPSDQNLYTSGNSIDLTFRNIFRNPSPSTLEFYFVLNSELGDNTQSQYDFLIECTSLNEYNLEFKLQPNPTNRFFSINVKGEKQIKIINSLGQLVKKINTNKQMIDVSQLDKGIYFICVISNDLEGVEKLLVR